MIRIKFCGITSPDEARAAQELGAHAIGVLVGRLHTAGDFVEPDAAPEIVRSVGPFLATVLVTHLEASDEIAALARHVPSHAIQLHSDLSARELAPLRERLHPRRLIGKVSVEGESAVSRAREIAPFVDAVLLDTRDRSTGRVGGTGKIHDWSISARIARESPVPVILAGGLTPENVADAIGAVRPSAVDVNSGIEDGDGKKSIERMKRFVAAVVGAV